MSMRAAVLSAHELGGVAVRERPEPAPGAGEVLIRVETVGVNQLDLNVIGGTGPGRAAALPRVLGIDPAGVIVAVGEGVDEARIGEPVVVKPNIPCGRCRWCQAGDEADCDSQTVLGVHRDGGAAEFVSVPATSAFDRGPLSAETATALVHSAPIVLNAMEKAGLRAGERVLVTGAGGALGRVAVALAQHRGATVTAASRRPIGGGAAPALIEPDAERLADRIAREGLEFDVVIDVTGHAPTLAAGIGALAWAGRAVFCAASLDTDLTIDARAFYLGRRTLRGVASASHHHVREALRLAAEGVIPPLVGARYDLESVADAYRNYPLATGGKVIVHVR